MLLISTKLWFNFVRKKIKTRKGAPISIKLEMKGSKIDVWLHGSFTQRTSIERKNTGTDCF